MKIGSLPFIVLMLLSTYSCLDGQKKRAFRDGQSIPDDYMNDDLSAAMNEYSEVPPVNELLRPTKQVFIANFCSCLNGKSDAVGLAVRGDCNSFCSSKNDAANFPILHINTTLGPQITLNEKLGNLYNWCNAPLQGGDTPECVLQLTDPNQNTISLELEMNSGQNSAKTLIKDLSFDTVYLARFVETHSGATSEIFSIKREVNSGGTVDTTNLKITSTHQYTCMTRSGSSVGFENVVRVHFYYTDDNTPPPLAQGSNNSTFCHDINKDGPNDSIEIERLELQKDAFKLWDSYNAGFYDQDGNGSLDINDEIKNKLVEQGQTENKITVFTELRWPNYPFATSPPRLGYLMVPWIDSQDKAYCPNNNHYGGNNPIFNIIGNLLGVETEAVYLAEKDPEKYLDSNGNPITAPKDILIIRESLLKKIWFYINDSKITPIQINDDTSPTKHTMMFYYPADTATPYMKKSYQRVYTIRSPDDLSISGGTANDKGIPTARRPSDKRYGCIPKHD